MMTRIEKDFGFSSGIHFDGSFFINTYNLMVSFLLETENPREHNIALERVEHYIENVLQDCVFVQDIDKDAIDGYTNANMRVCVLPEQPYDQIIAMVILLKLNAITEGRVKVTDLTIGSYLSEGVKYPIVSEIAENADILIGNHWWNTSHISIQDEDITVLPDNVVSLFEVDEWVSVGLSWKEQQAS